MKTMDYTLKELIEIGEIKTAEELSTKWCMKNKNWYSRQKHAGGDFSIDAAINCLRRTRQRLAERHDDEGKRRLADIEKLLSNYLLQQHKVAEVAND
ncbi:hypothetical protein [Ruegeria sp. HKCCD7221]|uniref:hypothetical protein n=1 Tax=Ruegeria sp. HKCCD7221 TaxID=2683009 RepID=UPI0014898F17|nr:hypothetical protein [Ruegeria sp. HKCCD7221]